jgi:hypothetical protein
MSDLHWLWVLFAGAVSGASVYVAVMRCWERWRRK